MLKINRQNLIKYSLSGLTVIVLVTAGFFLWNNPRETKAGWWNDSWAYRKAININGSKITGNLTNFPILINFTDTDLAGHAQEDGDDIIFVSVSGEKLSHEIEKYASTTGELVAWVKMPELVSSTDTYLYMYYGNAGVSAQEDPENVWDENYKMVHHLEEGGTGTRYDSTVNRNDGVTTGYDASSAVTAKINGGDYFNGADQITIPNSDSIFTATGSSFTVSLWFKAPDTAEIEHLVGSISDAYWFDLGNPGWSVFIRDSGAGGLLKFAALDSNGVRAETYGSIVDDDEWHYVSARLTPSGLVQYLDGVGDAADTDTPITGSFPKSWAFYIGYDEYNQYHGIIDEVRFSDVSRSSSWIATEYNNQSSTSTFYSVQSQEIGPGPITYWRFDEGYGATTSDATVNNNKGVLSFGTSTMWASEDKCVVGKCLFFDGYNDYLDSTHVGMDKDIGTLNMWVKYSGTYIDTQYFFDSDTARHAFYTSSNGTGIYMYNDGYITRFDNILPSANKWFYVSFVWNKTGNVQKIYIDGVEKNGVYESGTWGSNSIGTNIHVGSRFDHTELWNGFIDEVKIYPYVRSAEQISQDYSASLAGQSTAHGVSAAFGGVSDMWMTDGLTGYWKMDEPVGTYDDDNGFEDAINGTGSANNGDANGNASTSAGKFGNCGVFDGTGDYIAYTPLIGNQQNWSVSVWFKTTSATGLMRIFQEASDSSNLYYLSINENATGDMEFGSYSPNWAGFSYTGIILNDGNWHNIIVSQTNKSYRELYIDGVLKRINTSTFGEFSAMTSGLIGSDIGNHYFNGKIDEFRIYNRELSPDEASKLYEWGPDPVAYWNMDEKTGNIAYDSVASTTYRGGNHGTLYNMATSTNGGWTLGKFGSALIFDGLDDYINANNSVAMLIPGSITLSAWVKLDAIPSTANTIISKYFATTQRGWIIQASGDISPKTWTMAISSNGTSYEPYRHSTSTLTTAWTHIAGVYDATMQTLDIYINGKLDNGTISGTIPTSQYTNTASVNIGRRSTGDSYFDGLIDDVRVYNYARNQKQILEDMSAGDPNPHPFLYLKFDEGASSTAYNSGLATSTAILNPGTSGGNTATTAMWAMNGKNGKAIELDGTDDRVIINDYGATTTLDYNIGQSLTISAWIYPESLATANKCILAKGSTGANANRYCNYGFQVTTAGVLDFYFRNVANTAWVEFVSNPGVIVINNWYHVLVKHTFGNSTSTKLYLNGEEIPGSWTGGTGNEAPIISNEALWIGANDSNTAGIQEPFDGLIDDVKIYPYLLPSYDVKTDYNQNKSAVMGQIGKSNSTATSSNSASFQYCVPGDTSACAPPVGEWSFDQKDGNFAYDISGNGYDGQLGILTSTSSSSPSWVQGKLGSALDFDGVNDVVRMGDVLDFTSSNMTISAWIYPEGWGGSSYSRIVDKDNYSGTGYQFLVLNSGQLNFSTVSSGASVSSDSGSISLNKWQHIVMTYDGANARFYVNGQTEGAPALTEAPSNTSNIFAIGNRATYLDRGFDGKIDQVLIYNYVRTPAQIAYEFNRGKPIAYWKFDECSGGTLYDSASAWNGATSSNGMLYLGTSGTTATGTCASSSDSFWYLSQTGKYNSAASFDGTNDYVKINNNQPLNSAIFSVTFWAKADTQDTNYQIFVQKLKGNDDDGYAFELRPTNDPDAPSNVTFVLRKTGTSYPLHSYTTIISGEWYHISGTYDGSNSKLYINGLLEKTYTGAQYATTTDPMYIGIEDGNPIYGPFDGMIDDAKVYNYALTAEQVRMDYAGGAVRFGD